MPWFLLLFIGVEFMITVNIVMVSYKLRIFSHKIQYWRIENWKLKKKERIETASVVFYLCCMYVYLFRDFTDSHRNCKFKITYKSHFNIYLNQHTEWLSNWLFWERFDPVQTVWLTINSQIQTNFIGIPPQNFISPAN